MWDSGYLIVFIFSIDMPIDKTIRVRYDLIDQNSSGPGPAHFIHQRNSKMILRDTIASREEISGREIKKYKKKAIR